MRLTLFLFVICALAAGPSQAQLGPAKVAASVAEFQTGVICDPPTTRIEEAPGTVAGHIELIDGEAQFVSHSHRVPAVRNISFGVKVRMADPAGLSSVQMITTHPPMGPEGVTEQTHSSWISGMELTQRYYGFDFDYELLPGIWHLRAEKDGVLIYDARFEVVPPEMMPELAGICGYEELLS